MIWNGYWSSLKETMNQFFSLKKGNGNALFFFSISIFQTDKLISDTNWKSTKFLIDQLKTVWMVTKKKKKSPFYSKTKKKKNKRSHFFLCFDFLSWHNWNGLEYILIWLFVFVLLVIQKIIRQNQLLLPFFGIWKRIKFCDYLYLSNQLSILVITSLFIKIFDQKNSNLNLNNWF